jgi:PKD repeat protein/predicted GH43/DUF377 family glycosyl hydrolase
MYNKASFLVITFLIISSILYSAEKWTEYDRNPVLTLANDQQAENPCVIFDKDKFSNKGPAAYYKMWFATEKGIAFAWSENGKEWTEYNNSEPLAGLQALGNMAYVLYDPNGFGGTTNYYRIWYWNGIKDSIEGIRTAESEDGINWTTDQPLRQHPTNISLQLVTDPGIANNYFYHTYGPGSILYNPEGLNTGSLTPEDETDDQPMSYNYVMYYNSSSEGLSTEGSIMQISLAYSVDGIYWIRYGDKPIIVPSGNAEDWDGFNRFNARVLKIGKEYLLWYSGSDNLSMPTPPTGRIGSGSSPNGIDWNFNLKTKINAKSESEFSIKESRGHSIIPKSTSSAQKYGIWTSVLNNINNYSINYYDINAGEPPCGEPKGIYVDKCTGYAPFPFIAWVNREEMDGCLYYDSDAYWVWDFGDGTVMEDWDLWTVMHTYEKHGIYTITATGFCNYDQQAFSDTQEIQVLEHIPPIPPIPVIPCFTAQPDSGFAPLAITFDPSCSQIPTNTVIVSYSWDFGDGQHIYGSNAQLHTYAIPGKYSVTLELTDSTGVRYAKSEIITIKGIFAPSGVTLEKQINRSLFKATAQNLLKWSANPQTYGCTVLKYNIYRKLSSQSDSSYQLIGSVDGNTFTFIDTNIALNERYSYVLTSVETDGHESAFSASVTNQ